MRRVAVLRRRSEARRKVAWALWTAPLLVAFEAWGVAALAIAAKETSKPEVGAGLTTFLTGAATLCVTLLGPARTFREEAGGGWRLSVLNGCAYFALLGWSVWWGLGALVQGSTLTLLGAGVLAVATPVGFGIIPLPRRSEPRVAGTGRRLPMPPVRRACLIVAGVLWSLVAASSLRNLVGGDGHWHGRHEIVVDYARLMVPLTLALTCLCVALSHRRRARGTHEPLHRDLPVPDGRPHVPGLAPPTTPNWPLR